MIAISLVSLACLCIAGPQCSECWKTTPSEPLVNLKQEISVPTMSLLTPVFSQSMDRSQLLSWLIIGDWGLPGSNQRDVARAMESYSPDFVLSCGDNFYETTEPGQNYEGVKSTHDPRFQNVWKNVYDTLQNVPWFVVLVLHYFTPIGKS